VTLKQAEEKHEARHSVNVYTVNSSNQTDKQTVLALQWHWWLATWTASRLTLTEDQSCHFKWWSWQ